MCNNNLKAHILTNESSISKFRKSQLKSCVCALRSPKNKPFRKIAIVTLKATQNNNKKNKLNR